MHETHGRPVPDIRSEGRSLTWGRTVANRSSIWVALAMSKATA